MQEHADAPLQTLRGVAHKPHRLLAVRVLPPRTCEAIRCPSLCSHAWTSSHPKAHQGRITNATRDGVALGVPTHIVQECARVPPSTKPK